MAPKIKDPVYVLGVGMTKFIKPRGKVDYTELGFEAGVKAMLDAQINYDDVDMGVACYCYGDSTCGQRVFYQFGQTSIPIWNVNNNCSTGSTGLYLGRNMIAGGQADAVLIARELLRDPYWPLRAAAELRQAVSWPVQYLRAAPAGAQARVPSDAEDLAASVEEQHGVPKRDREPSSTR